MAKKEEKPTEVYVINENDLFHALETEDEFDRFMNVTVSTLGTALLQDPNRDRKQVDEMCELTMHNIMFLCQEYHGLVTEGKIPPVRPENGMTKEKARKEVLEQLKTVELFFNIARDKQKEETQNEEKEKNDANSES